MKEDEQINIFKVLDFIRDNAAAYAKAKAARVYLENFRKTKKALCMVDAQKNGVSRINEQERDAYSHEEYQQLLDGLRVAVEEEERLRWLMVGAEAKIEVWRTLEANRRVEAKAL